MVVATNGFLLLLLPKKRQKCWLCLWRKALGKTFYPHLDLEFNERLRPDFYLQNWKIVSVSREPCFSEYRGKLCYRCAQATVSLTWTVNESCSQELMTLKPIFRNQSGQKWSTQSHSKGETFFGTQAWVSRCRSLVLYSWGKSFNFSSLKFHPEICPSEMRSNKKWRFGTQRWFYNHLKDESPSSERTCIWFYSQAEAPGPYVSGCRWWHC